MRLNRGTKTCITASKLLYQLVGKLFVQVICNLFQTENLPAFVAKKETPTVLVNAFPQYHVALAHLFFTMGGKNKAPSFSLLSESC